MIDKAYKLQVNKQLAAVLHQHKANLVNKGIKLPLSNVPFVTRGLLAELPKIKAITGWPWNIQVDDTIYQPTLKWPKITIVVPSYNQSEFIEEALRSILLQNYPNLELIVMDGGSTDNTKQILEQYSQWISYWQSEKDNGQGQAINMGFSIASGDYLGWLNSDDFYIEQSFFVLGSEIMRSNRAIYYGDALSVNKDNSEQTYWQANLVKNSFLRFGGVIASHSAFWKRSINQPIWERMNCNVDGELWIRLVKNQSRKHIKFPLGAIRFYDDTKSADDKWKDKWLEDDLNIERIHGSPPDPCSLKARVYRVIQRFYKRYNKKMI